MLTSLWIRSVRLVIGLILYGVGCAIMVAAGIGLDPWMVLSQGVALQTGIGIGWATNAIGFIVLLLWIPLRQRPGAGTVLNILLVGTALQIALPLLPTPDHPIIGGAMFALGVVLVGFASGLYIGAELGPGPRDGLMTGISRRVGWPIWVSRTSVEVSVLIVGWALGGTVGVGTIAFAASIGPLCQFFLRVLGVRRQPVSVPGRTAKHSPGASVRAERSSRRSSRDMSPRHHPLPPS